MKIKSQIWSRPAKILALSSALFSFAACTPLHYSVTAYPTSSQSLTYVDGNQQVSSKGKNVVSVHYLDETPPNKPDVTLVVNVKNNSSHAFEVSPKSIWLAVDSKRTSPINPKEITRMLNVGLALSGDAATYISQKERVDRFSRAHHFRRNTIAPGKSYQGRIYVKMPRDDRQHSIILKVMADHEVHQFNFMAGKG